MDMRTIIIAAGMVAALASCTTVGGNDARAIAQRICDNEPAAYGFVVAIDAQVHLDPALMRRVRTAHLVVDDICHPLPSDVAGILAKLQSAWAIIQGAQQTAQAARR